MSKKRNSEIPFEVLKQLKDLGFPQLTGEHCRYKCRVNWKTMEHIPPVYIPTVEELISARMRYGTFKMWQTTKKGGAVQEEGVGLDDVTWYPSLEEAIARSLIAKMTAAMV